MKKLFTILLLLPTCLHAKVNIFSIAGGAVNTSVHQSCTNKQSTWNPSLIKEVGFQFNEGKGFTVGAIARQYNISSKGAEILTNEVGMVGTAGYCFVAGKVSLLPSIEAGTLTSKTKGTVLGCRLDAVYSITKTIGIRAGISADYYSFKNISTYLYAGKIGINISL